MPGINPYHAVAGPQLDALIHQKVLGNSADGACPAYSTDAALADQVRRSIEKTYKEPVITGRTQIRGRSWFARYERDPSTSTEVLAETYPLAVCRLALLRALKP